MSLGSGNLLLASAGDTGYNLTRSLRFRASASAYLSRTPASATNQRVMTFSAWVKRGALGGSSYQVLYSAHTGTDVSFIGYGNGAYSAGGDYFEVGNSSSGGTLTFDVRSNAVYRDPSSWYHVVVAIDTTQATAANRILLYVNNVQLSSTTTGTVSLNFQMNFNNTVVHNVGRLSRDTNSYFDGYLAEVNFIDGQALTPSSFGSTNALTGVWQPARYTGTYGTNGFYLPFTDNSALTTSSNVGLGKDFSGNGNYWTTNNISITADVTYDSMTDVPTLTSATAANFAVANPLSVGANTALTNGNLSGTLTGAGGWSSTIAGLSFGKWYYEATVTANSGNSMWVGFLSNVYTKNDNAWSFSTQTALYANDARNGNNASYGATWTTNDVIGVAIDLSTSSGSITFYKNGVSQGVMFSSLTTSAVWRPLVSGGGTGTTIAMNFGQRPFSYTPPTGFVALNTYNLPTSTILQGNKVMDATLYTGNGGTQAVTNAGGFKPDLVWQKSRSNAISHILNDSVRGVSKTIYSNLTNAEASYPGYNVTAFNSNGFSVGDDSAGAYGSNGTGQTYVGWQWQAGQGSTSSNTSGSITSTVSVNASAGFSVVTYTGTGANATVGHGLGVAPSLIIGKKRSSTGNWQCWQATLGGTQYISLNSTAGVNTSSTVFNGAPTSTVFNLGTDTDLNASGATNVAYCWSEIAGFSKFGSYTGNGSADGAFVYCGLLPRFLLIKRTDTTASWRIFDTARDPSNVEGYELYPNLSNAESSFAATLDGLSNGFKIRSSDVAYNASGGTYIFAAFASNPFKNSLAR